jgi:hypothetical protein
MVDLPEQTPTEQPPIVEPVVVEPVVEQSPVVDMTKPETYVPQVTGKSSDPLNKLVIASKLDIDPDYYVRNEEWLKKDIPKPEVHPLVKDALLKEEEYLPDGLFEELIYGSEQAVKTYNDISNLLTGTFADQIRQRRNLETEKQDIVFDWLKGEHNIKGRDELRVLEINDELSKFQEMHPEGVSNFSFEVANAIAQSGGVMSNAAVAGGVVGVTAGTVTAVLTGSPPLAAKVAVDSFKFTLNASMAWDNFKASTAEAYSSLDGIYDDKGNALPYSDKRTLAVGIGSLNAAIDFLGDKMSLNRIPGIGKIFKKAPVADLVLNPKNAAVRKTLMTIGEVMFTQGTTEGAQSVISKIGDELGKAKVEGGYGNADIFKVLADIENTWKPALYEGAVGAVAGATTHAVLSPFAYRENLGSKIEDRAGEFRKQVAAGKTESQIPEHLRPTTPEEWQSIADEKPYAADQKKVDDINNLAERYKQAKTDMKFGEKIKELVKIYRGSPELGDAKLKERITTQFSKVLGLDVAYLDPVKLGEIYMDLSDDTLKAQLDEMMNRNQAGLIKAPIAIPIVDFLRMTNQDKQKGHLLGLAVMPTADSQTADRANYFINGIQKVLDGIKPDSNLTFAQIAEQVIAKIGDTDYSHVTNESDLLDIGQIPDDIRDAFTDRQQTDIELAQALAGRQEFKVMTQERKEMVADLSNVIAKRKLKAGLADSEINIEGDQNIKHVDLYMDNKYNKDFLLFRINPDTLSPEQKEKYLKSERLSKELGMFSKDGDDAQTVADSLEYQSVDHMMSTLGETLSTGEAKLWNELLLKEATQDEATVEARKLRNKNRTELTQKYFSDTKKILTNMTNHLADYIESKSKSLGKKFIFTRPRIEVIDTNAAQAISNTTIAELGSIKRFLRAAKERQKDTYAAIMDGDFPKAMKAWEATLYAEAMHRHATQAIQNRDHLSERIRGLRKEDNAAMFRSAGSQYVDAANYILDLISPNKNIKKTIELNDFTTWRNSEMAKGNAVPPIPPRFHDNGLADVNNYTNLEISGILNSVNALYALADYKTELQLEQFGKKETLAVDTSVTKIIGESSALGRSDRAPQAGKESPAVMNALNWYISGNTRIMTLARMLDGYKMDGEAQKIIQNISNKYDQFIVNFDAFHKSFSDDIAWFNNQNPKAKFEDMKLREFYVPELHGTELTKDGNITEAELFGALLNMGNAGNAKRLAMWGTSEAQFQAIIGRHLEDRHLQMAQKIWDYYEAYKPAIREANLKSYGSSDVKWVDARPLTITLAGGKEVNLRGGYYPIVSEWINTDLRQKTTLGAVISGNQVGEYLKYGGFEDFTDTSHLQHRVEESSNPVSLDPSHFIKRYKAMIYDTSMRESLMFGAKVFNHPDMRAQLLSFFGKTQDAESFGKFIEAVGAARNKEDYGSANKLIVALEKNRTVYTLGKLAFKKLSLVNQMLSLALFPTMMEDKYKTILIDVPKTIKDITTSPELYRERLRFYSQYNPKIMESMNEFLDIHTGQIRFNEPLLRFDPRIKGYGLLRTMNNAANASMEIGMIGIKHADILTQIITLETIYRKGRAGEITGIDANNEAAILEFANKVVSERVTGNNITQIADFQRNRVMKVALMTFMGGLNLTYNTIRENANMLSDSYSKDRKEQDSSIAGDATFVKPGAKMRQEVFHNAMFVLASYAVLPTLLRAGTKWYEDDKFKEEDLFKDFITNLASPFPVVSGILFKAVNDFGAIVPMHQQVNDFLDMTTFYIQHLTRTNDKSWKKDKNYKGTVMQTANLLGVPSDFVWNTFASPKATKNMKKNTRGVIRSLQDEYDKFIKSDEFGNLTDEQREDVTEITAALKQLENGNVAPIEALNKQAAEYNGEVVETATPRTESKPLSEEEKVSVKEWFKGLFDSSEPTKDENDTTPIQQEAPAEDSAASIDDQFLPSAGSTIADAKQLDNIAKIYGKKGLNTGSMSKNAFVEYEKIKDKYLEVLNDSSISEQNKLMRLSALVVALGEDFKGVAYDDKQPNKVLQAGDKIKGVLTIGYGFTKDVKIGDTMTKDEGVQRLVTELESRAKTLNAAEKKHGLDLNINQRVALISTIYNGAWAPDSYKNSTAAIKKGYFEPLLANTLESSSQTHIDGLLKRRLLEYLIFNVAPPVAKISNKNSLTAKANWQDTIIR